MEDLLLPLDRSSGQQYYHTVVWSTSYFFLENVSIFFYIFLVLFIKSISFVVGLPCAAAYFWHFWDNTITKSFGKCGYSQQLEIRECV